MTVDEAALSSHGANFLRCKDMVGEVKTTLLFQARKEAGVPNSDGKIVWAADISFVRTK
jgi:hypothetical protein